MKTTYELDENELSRAAAHYALRNKKSLPAKDFDVSVRLSVDLSGDEVKKIYATVTYEDDQ